MPRTHIVSTTALLAAGLACLLAPLQAQAKGPALAGPAGRSFDPTQVEVIVVGSPHLRQIDPKDRPPTDRIRRALARFEPDHVVVEWLHPSVDPSTTGNYRPFENLDSLARLWGYDRDPLDVALVRTLDSLGRRKLHGLPTASTRVELGKLRYLSRDRLNAGYQWWIAERSGAEVSDLERLTSGNFENHELEVWGFPIAFERGIEYLTPFDYQGDDAAWIWTDIVAAVAVHAIEKKHGLKEGDVGWDDAVERYSRSMQAHASKEDSSWLGQYGDIQEVAEFAQVVDLWNAKRSKEGRDHPAGLPTMRYLQTEEHEANKRYMYDEVFPRISLDGLGRRLVDNWILRNRRMVDFVEQDVERLGRTRVMILVGEGHRPFIDEELRKRGYRVMPTIEFIP